MPGQAIPVVAELDNVSNVEVLNIHFALKKVRRKIKLGFVCIRNSAKVLNPYAKSKYTMKKFLMLPS